MQNLEFSNFFLYTRKKVEIYPTRIEFVFTHKVNPLREGLTARSVKRKRLVSFLNNKKKYLFNLTNNSGGVFRLKTTYFYPFRRGRKYVKKRKRKSLKTVAIVA